MSFLTYKPKPIRCHNCNRRIYATDFARGLAEGEEVWYDTMGGPDSRDEYYHTYDCESVKRRLTTSEGK